jgi:hypothetical protein
LQGSLAPLALSIGQDALPADVIPANVVSVTPAPGKILAPRQSIVIKFNESMDGTSVASSGDMAAETSPDYSFTRSRDQFIYNDELTMSPASQWSAGARSVNIALKDQNGNDSNLSLSWHVLASGQSPTPDFSTCVPPNSCGQRWFLPYSTQFIGQEGVPFGEVGDIPIYQWRTENIPVPVDLFLRGAAPPHDVELFRTSGILAGGPTNCFLCTFIFNVCIKDAIGTETCHEVHWGSGL